MRALILPTLLLFAAMPARADEPAPAVQDQIEAFFSNNVMIPETADWRFLTSRPFLGGTLWCGKVNLMNSARKYMGFRPFYATVFPDGIRQGTIMGGRSDDPVGSTGFKLKVLCGF